MGLSASRQDTEEKEELDEGSQDHTRRGTPHPETSTTMDIGSQDDRPEQEEEKKDNDKPKAMADQVQYQAGEWKMRRIDVHQKIFYLNVRRKWWGQLLKITEVGQTNQRVRIHLSMPAAEKFRYQLGEFIECYDQLGPTDVEVARYLPTRLLKSKYWNQEGRMYRLELRGNRRGRFILFQQSRVSQGSGGHDSAARKVETIVLPAEGFYEFRDSMTSLLQEEGQAEELGVDKQKQSTSQLGKVSPGNPDQPLNHPGDTKPSQEPKTFTCWGCRLRGHKRGDCITHPWGKKPISHNRGKLPEKKGDERTQGTGKAERAEGTQE